MESTFFSIAMKYFQYLVTDYNFSIKKVEESERAPKIEGRIEFESPTTFVTVSGEQWGADVYVGRVKDDKYYYFLDARTIYEYVSLTEADKQLVCSFYPKDDRKAKMIIHQIRLLHNKKDSNSLVDSIESKLADYSRWLREYAEPFLRGDFSDWLEIYEFTFIRQRAEHVRSGKEEFVRVTGRNKDERESIFQSSLDYLEKLREEYGNK